MVMVEMDVEDQSLDELNTRITRTILMVHHHQELHDRAIEYDPNLHSLEMIHFRSAWITELSSDEQESDSLTQGYWRKLSGVFSSMS